MESAGICWTLPSQLTRQKRAGKSPAHWLDLVDPEEHVGVTSEEHQDRSPQVRRLPAVGWGWKGSASLIMQWIPGDEMNPPVSCVCVPLPGCVLPLQGICKVHGF